VGAEDPKNQQKHFYLPGQKCELETVRIYSAEECGRLPFATDLLVQPIIQEPAHELEIGKLTTSICKTLYLPKRQRSVRVKRYKAWTK
jgi:uncharacterized protein Smg (DUF494 family)